MRIKLLALLLLIAPSFLKAECCERPAMLSIGVGTFDTIRPKEREFQFQVDYKWAACWHGVQPIASAFVTHKGAVYVCFGACYDIFLGPVFVLTPSFAPGLYFKNKGKELGHVLEFRSAISLAARFCNQDRLGIQFYHISNAKIGFKNPGEESLILFYGYAF